MMKILFVLSVLVALSGALAGETYTPENDDLDIDALVKDKNKLLAFFECFIGKGECDPVAADFKKDLPEAVEEACAKCTPAQKHILRKFLQGLKDIAPSGSYEEFKNKLDPNNKYFVGLEAAIANS